MSGALHPPSRTGTGEASVHLVGVGPGPIDLMSVRASRLIAMSGTCLYTHGVVPREAMALCPPTAKAVDTSAWTDDQSAGEIAAALERGDRVVHLFAGDPGQHPESSQLSKVLDTAGIAWELVPGILHPGFPAPVTAAGSGAGPGEGAGAGAGGHPAPGARSAAGERPTAANEPSVAPGSDAQQVGDPGLILVLGGTSEARKLADLLVAAGLEVVTALAGKLARPRLPRGEVRIGGFGGADGLAQWLRENEAGAIIDATDPFSGQISADAARAAADTGVALLRVQRPRWTETEGDTWIRVPDMQSAVAAVQGRFRRPMLTVGKLGASAFSSDSQGAYLIRCSEPPPGPLPNRYLLVLDRGPFGVDSERTIMSRHRIDVLVTRDSGGRASAAKLEAARTLGIPVVMIERPAGDTITSHPDAAPHPAPENVETVETVEDAARWLVGRFGSR